MSCNFSLNHLSLSLSLSSLLNISDMRGSVSLFDPNTLILPSATESHNISSHCEIFIDDDEDNSDMISWCGSLLILCDLETQQ